MLTDIRMIDTMKSEIVMLRGGSWAGRFDQKHRRKIEHGMRIACIWNGFVHWRSRRTTTNVCSLQLAHSQRSSRYVQPVPFNILIRAVLSSQVSSASVERLFIDPGRLERSQRQSLFAGNLDILEIIKSSTSHFWYPQATDRHVTFYSKELCPSNCYYVSEN